MTDTAEYERRGLYDPKAPNAADRLALLEWLADQGIGVDQMEAANHEHQLTALASDLALQSDDGMTAAELAAAAAVSLDVVGRMVQAAGFPPLAPGDRVFRPDDVDTIRLFVFASEFFGETATLRFTRMAGTSMAQIADAAVWAFLSNVEGPLMEQERGELALAQASLNATRTLELLPQVMRTLLRGHADAAIRRSRLSRPTDVYNAARLAVGFVDLVGFTTLSQQVAGSELVAVVDEFEERAFAVVSEHEGRVVKLIGDEVMFVALDASAACRIAIELAASFESERGITPRGGLAAGELFTRAGDYFGPVVNLASRIAELAVPGEVLVSRSVYDEAAETPDLDFSPAGRRMLKGFSDPVELFAVIRPA